MKHIPIAILLICMLFSVTDMDAQRRKRRTRNSEIKVEEKKDFKDQLNYEIKLGSPNLFSTFALAAKGNVGYKVGDHFTAGIGMKGLYQYINYIGPVESDHLFSYSFFPMARFKFLQQFYIQGEYHYAQFPGYDIYTKLNTFYPTLGGGYMNRGEDWSYGTEINVILNDEVIDRVGPIEIWLNFSKNF